MEVHLRMCVATRKLKPKQELVRLVKKDGVILIDEKQKMQGRGVFVSKDAEIVKSLKKSKALNKAFKMQVPDEIYDKLEKLCQSQS